MLDREQTLDFTAIVDRTRSLWRDARDHATTARVELYAKIASRARVARGLGRTGANFDRSLETGIALRVFDARHNHAGFAAASGLSAEVVRWAVDSASTFQARAPLSAPSASDAIAGERLDLDAEIPLPSEGALIGSLLARPHLDRIEAGTTVEVLIGAEGWLAARRRHRLWARTHGSGAKLVAQRGIVNWEGLLDRIGPESSECPRGSGVKDVLVLTPEAAAPVVTALVTAFHGPGAQPLDSTGTGWEVSDDPLLQNGLAGGSFDDAGFPSGTRTLAAEGVWVGRLEGPGCFRRASFREPPTEAATNLCMPAGAARIVAIGGPIVDRCRIIRPSRRLWVIELDQLDPRSGGLTERQWIRVEPKTLLFACRSRLGGVSVTSSGPVVPSLSFEGLHRR